MVEMEACCLCNFVAKNGQKLDDHIENQHSDIFVKVSVTKDDIGNIDKGQNLEEKATKTSTKTENRYDVEFFRAVRHSKDFHGFMVTDQGIFISQ